MKIAPRSPRTALLAIPALAALLALTLASPVKSEDIDIYAGGNTSTSRPNVLFFVDNSANWGQAFDWEKLALQTVFSGLPDTMNAGLMLFSETGSPNSNTDGAYVRYAMRQMTGTARTNMGNLIAGLDQNGDKGNGGKIGIGMSEVHRYLAGLGAYAGHNKTKADALAFTSNSIVGPTYRSPVADACQKSIVVIINNGPPSDSSSDSTTSRTHLVAAGGDGTRISPPDKATGADENMADEWARFLRQRADLSSAYAGQQYATTYVIEVLPKTNPPGVDNTALMKSIANQGGGRYFDANNAAELVAALASIIAEVQAVNSVFASASLPISVNTQGTHLNQVFMGMFRPDAGALPRWSGNLKQYKLSHDAALDTVRLVDRNGRLAVSASTGFFVPDATSLWSSSSTFWTNQPQGTPPHASDAPDGEVVEKGGVAQRLRTDYATSQAARKVLTCQSATGACGGLRDFTATNLSGTTLQSTFGVPDASSLSALISWARGADNFGDEFGPGGTTTVRPSIHGDVVHSRPAAVDYGGSRGVVVFYGANDGMLRAVGAHKDTGTGNELWSFVPPEFYPRIKRLRDNEELVYFPNIPSEAGATRRNWGVDGPIGLYQDAGSVHIFVPMRRGGRFLYAFNVTDPANPVFMWRVSNAQIPELGQTWSEPKPTRIRGHAGPVLIMGAGYDADAEDPETPTTPTMGRGVLVLDAANGNLLRRFPTTRSVPGDITLVDSNFDGLIDRAYAADLGGKIYRIDFENSTGANTEPNWQQTVLADLGASRKFFAAPDVVITRTHGLIMAGSGDRERPLATVTNNRVYGIKDTLPGFPLPGGLNYPATVLEADLVVTGSPAQVLAAAKGWYLALNATGEKVVTTPLTVAGTTYFSTHRPTPPVVGSCTSNLGEARTYGVSFLTGAPRPGQSESIVITGGGFPPAPVSGVVEINGVHQLFLIGGGARNTSFEAEKPKIPIPPTRRRIYWHICKDNGSCPPPPPPS